MITSVFIPSCSLLNKYISDVYVYPLLSNQEGLVYRSRLWRWVTEEKAKGRNLSHVSIKCMGYKEARVSVVKNNNNNNNNNK